MADYRSSIAVQPFVIGPQPFRSMDAGFIFAPAWMYRRESEIIALMYETYNRAQVKSKYFIQIKSILGQIFVTTTLRSGVLDERTGRRGLKFTFGISVEPIVFREIQSHFLYCFTASLYCLCSIAAKGSFDLAAESILTVFQKDKEASRRIEEHRAFESLLGEFEQKFWETRQKGVWRFLYGGVPNGVLFPELPRSQPLASIEDVRNYWKKFERCAHGHEADESASDDSVVLNVLANEVLRAGLVQKVSEALERLRRRQDENSDQG